MIAKIVIKSDTEAVIVYDDLPSKKLTSVNIRAFIQWFFNPDVKITYDEYQSAIAKDGETCPIILKEIA